MHRNGYGSGNLASDLLEVQRAVRLDHEVMLLLHHGKVDAGDFQREDNGVRMSETGRSKVFARFRRMKELVSDKANTALLAQTVKGLDEGSQDPDFENLQLAR